MHASPVNTETEALVKDIYKLKGVLDVHDVHIWSLTPATTIGTAHLIVKPQNKTQKTLDEAKKIFHTRGIHSSVVQIETALDDRWKAGPTPCYDMVCEKDKDLDFCCEKRRLMPPKTSDNESVTPAREVLDTSMVKLSPGSHPAREMVPPKDEADEKDS